MERQISCAIKKYTGFYLYDYFQLEKFQKNWIFFRSSPSKWRLLNFADFTPWGKNNQAFIAQISLVWATNAQNYTQFYF